MSENYKKVIHDQVFDKKIFIRAVFSGYPDNDHSTWVRVVIRPVEVKGKYYLQFSYFDKHKDISKNYSGDESVKKMDEILESPFRNIYVETTENSVHIQRTKKGKILIGKGKPASPSSTADLSHDHLKTKLLSGADALPFLQAVGIASADGKIKADMQKKFQQVNEFLRLIDETGAFEGFTGKPIRIVDFGCGKAYLTFAIYYYLVYILKMDAVVIGVDIKSDLFSQNVERSKMLGWDNLIFQDGSIADYEPDFSPDVVVALHACDTATDDALAQGIRWGSKLIITAPCCQHELQQQLSQKSYPSQMSLVSHYGILKERMGDILTDTFRASILQILGYRTDITQFVSSEHTAKNLMIRSLRTHAPGDKSWINEYQALKKYWQVTPYLERLLGDEYSKWFLNDGNT